MKKLLIASAIAIAASTAAYAQGASGPAGDNPNNTSPTTTGSIPNARMEVIRNYWRSERPRAVVLPEGTVISRGSVVPSTVVLNTFPDNVDSQYRYVVVGNTMYLVNPSDRKVVQVVE